MSPKTVWKKRYFFGALLVAFSALLLRHGLGHGQRVLADQVLAESSGVAKNRLASVFQSGPADAQAGNRERLIRIEPRVKLPESREEVLKTIASLQLKQLAALEKLSPSFENLSESEQQDLLKGLLQVSRDRNELKSFLESLAEPLRSETAEFVAAVFELQDSYLVLEGRGRESLLPKKVEMPKRLQEQAEQLRAETFPGEIDAHVRAVAHQEAISAEDIDKLGRLCSSLAHHRGNCMQKGVLVWLDSNHLLSESQMKLVESFF